MWFGSSNPCTDTVIGFSPLPYFVFGCATVVGLSAVAISLYRSGNTTRRGLKNIDVILPVYKNAVYYVLIVGIIVGGTNIAGFLVTEVYSSLIKWFLYRFVTDGLAVFLMHNGIGVRALNNSLLSGAGKFRFRCRGGTYTYRGGCYGYYSILLVSCALD